MSLLKQRAEKKPLRIPGAAAFAQSTLRPMQVEKEPPCKATCPAGTRIRDWLQVIAQREKLGLSYDQAMMEAWRIVSETNPFPAVTGRVCPHPCEGECTRDGKDGSVSVHLCERFLGDVALENKWPLSKTESTDFHSSVGVVGAGPAGLSFAYQMARLGHAVTVYEKAVEPGGMMQWGIPAFRLPRSVLKAEISRLADLGIEIQCGVEVGVQLSLEKLKAAHRALFVGIGAGKTKTLSLPGESGSGVLSGTEFLAQTGLRPDALRHQKVVVIGGGDAAVDAARYALRLKASKVTVACIETRETMPSHPAEIAFAEEEGATLCTAVRPVSINRQDGTVRSVTFAFEEVPSRTFDCPADLVVEAVYREPDLAKLGGLVPGDVWVEIDDHRRVVEDVWAGGDMLRPGLLSEAIGHGRAAARFADAALRGETSFPVVPAPNLVKERIKLTAEDVYPPSMPAETDVLPLHERMETPTLELVNGLSKEIFLKETSRCLSCGRCFGCERCFSFCTPRCFSKAAELKIGKPYYTINIAKCDGCKKCDDECPSGFIDMV